MRQKVNNAVKANLKDLCLTADEASLIKKFQVFQKPFKCFTNIIGTSMPILSLIFLIKQKIKKLCESHDHKSYAMKQVKVDVFAKQNCRLEVSKVVKTRQLQDPSTKNHIPRTEAAKLLHDIIHNLQQRSFINVDAL